MYICQTNHCLNVLIQPLLCTDSKKELFAAETKTCIEQDSFQDLESLKIKMDNAVLPSDHFKLIRDDAVNFIAVQKVALVSTLLQNLSIIITKNLILNAFVDFVHLSKKIYEHLLSSFSVNIQTEVCNILAKSI